jgi:phosphoribosyl 1,2-cyclic phosphodiesterase
MRVRFWGVRGSTPTPTPGNLKYGGNTACVEVRTAEGQLLIFDAGSGIRGLGRLLLGAMPPQGHRIMLFLTHYHWDHIQGFPFFEPMYAPQNYVYLHGFQSPCGSVEQALAEQMANPFFPVDMGVMRATRNFYTIREETLQIGDARIVTRFLNHPQGCLGYRIEDAEGVLVYATDNEHGHPKGDENLRRLAENADLLIYDAQYTPEEYKSKVGWGHSTWREGVQLAQEVGVKEVILFHHDPDHSDFFLDTMVEEARGEFPSVHAAREGMEIDLARFSAEPAGQRGFNKRYNSRHQVALPLAVRLHDLATQEEYTLAENISLDGAYFLAQRPFETGKELELGIEVSGNGHSRKIIAAARVVRCEPVGDKVGVGITFR